MCSPDETELATKLTSFTGRRIRLRKRQRDQCGKNVYKRRVYPSRECERSREERTNEITARVHLCLDDDGDGVSLHIHSLATFSPSFPFCRSLVNRVCVRVCARVLARMSTNEMEGR